MNPVRRSPRPSRIAVAGSEGCSLHLRLLVFVGEEVSRELALSLLNLSAGGGTNQRAYVGQHRQMLLIEQGLHLGESGMEPKRTRAGRSDGQQTRLRQGQHRADLLVRAVSGAAQGDNHVIAVVAAEQEDADQGLVVLGTLGQCVHQCRTG